MDNFVFDTFISGIKEFSENTYKILTKSEEYKKEAQLYHYTSLEAFQSMVQNESLRATINLTVFDRYFHAA
ncbi:MAG: hypothetical protein WD048_04290 [Chitinophagales bacterium]